MKQKRKNTITLILWEIIGLFTIFHGEKHLCELQQQKKGEISKF